MSYEAIIFVCPVHSPNIALSSRWVSLDKESGHESHVWPIMIPHVLGIGDFHGGAHVIQAETISILTDVQMIGMSFISCFPLSQ